MPKGSDDFLTLVARFFKDIVPEADAEDARNGAGVIPHQVTDARRAGQNVQFIQEGQRSEWHWLMPDGERVALSD